MRAGHCPIHPAGMIDLRSQLADLLEERDGSGGRVILSLLTAHPKLLLLHLHTERCLAYVQKFNATVGIDSPRQLSSPCLHHRRAGPLKAHHIFKPS